MRKSKVIALSLLGLGTAGLAAGCGSSNPTEPGVFEKLSQIQDPSDKTTNHDDSRVAEPIETLFEPDDTWYDEEGKEIPLAWTTDASGNNVPVIYPHDQIGRPWIYHPTRFLVPPPPILVTIVHGNGSTYVNRVGGAGPRTQAMVTHARGGFGTTGGRITFIGG